MATTVATAATTVKDRLLVDNTTATAPPSDVMIQGYVRDGFRHLFGILQPVFREEVTLDSALAANLTTVGTVQYVNVNRTLLFPTEWSETDAGLVIEGHNIASNTDTALVWTTRTPDLSGLTVESSCIFGSDWLEPIALLWAEMQVQKRMAATSNTATGQYSMVYFRMIEEKFEKAVAEYRRTRAEWIGTMENRLNYRAGLGRPPIRDSALSQGFGKSGLRIRNPLTRRY